MTDQDIKAAIAVSVDVMKEKLERTQDNLTFRWGRGVKRTDREQHALAFAKRLNAIGGTFEFTKEHREFGYETIWEAFAGELHEQGVKPKERAANADEHAALYSSGFKALNSTLIEDWSDALIFAVPRRVDGAQIEVITINPHLIVNIEGQTAFDVWTAREIKRSTGQLRSSATKLTRVVGPDCALTELVRMAENLPSMVAVPAGRREALPEPDRSDEQQAA
jgi:hypothetical protein